MFHVLVMETWPVWLLHDPHHPHPHPPDPDPTSMVSVCVLDLVVHDHVTDAILDCVVSLEGQFDQIQAMDHEKVMEYHDHAGMVMLDQVKTLFTLVVCAGEKDPVMYGGSVSVMVTPVTVAVHVLRTVIV